uniref:Metalloendopeptidase n=1 Tax=Panagrolaimus sp. PS1159 TaxID=55785 RepID=A0AC35GXM3_9BILA
MIPFLIAMHHWQNFTCLSFVPFRPSIDKNYIIFTTDKCGCCSYVGRRGDGGQIISIGKNCDKFGIIVHEIGHVVGFSHEHTRPDRDHYVEIFRNNIQQGQDYNFDKAKPNEIDSRGETYDYHSIMHYARDTFARGGYFDTILPKKPTVGERPKIGQRTKLSEGDIRQTKKMYHCPDCFHTLLSNKDELRYDQNKTKCNWRILSARGSRIAFNISTKILPKATAKSCYYEKNNYIEIRDGFQRNSLILGKLCHSNYVKSFLTSSNSIFIHVSTASLLAPFVFATYYVTCGGSISGNNNAIQSPSFPELYPPDSFCVWNITVSQGYRVAATFRYFNLEPHKNCSYDKLEIYESTISNSETLIGRFCGQNIPKFITTNTSNSMIVKFTSDASIQKTGFHIEFLKELDECEFKKNQCEHICINRIGGYECDCFSGYSLKPDGYTCESTCGGQLTENSGHFFSPNFPANYSSNKKCVWEIKVSAGYRIVLNFTHFNVEGLKSECEYDYVHLKPISNIQNGDEIKLCGEYNIPVILMSLTNEIKISFNSDNSMERSGFAAEYFIDFDECSKDNGNCEQICVNTIGSYECRCSNGLTLSEDGHSCVTGECFFQNYEPFGNIRKNCTWHIVTIPGHHILLTFDVFDVEDHYACRYDQVAVYNGGDHSAPLLGSFCGQTPPLPLISSGNQLLVELQSDDTQPRRGFNASYTSADFSVGFVYSHARYGDRKYSKLTQCIWEIYAEADLGVKIRFTQLDIEKERACEYDYVAVYDGLKKHNELLIGQFCGEDLSSPIISSSNGLLVEFVTDDNVEKKGFVFEYSATNPLQKLKQQKLPVRPDSSEPILND